MDSSASQPPFELKFIPTAATFKLLEPLGVGTVGTVYRAESPEISHPVAVKMLHPTIAHDPNIVDRFQREITIMERLNHPHIVRNFGGGLIEGHYFYAMQLLEHGSLKDRLSEYGPLPWAQAAAFSAQIASALQHAHNHSIIHRDLKASNLFFDDKGGIVLGDFGIARDTQESDVTADGITVGTYAYMSPEQICADKEISGKADLYSLGCVIYEMLTGKPPFQGVNFAQIWDQHLHKQPRGLREQGIDCPEWFEKLVMQLLEKDPERRPFNARAVQGIIKDRLEDEFGSEIGRLTKNLPPLEDIRHTDGTNWARVLIGVLAIGAIIAMAIYMDAGK
ncbi:MAG: serine/threonine-protein kinase [Planctomycetota bacterium]